MKDQTTLFERIGAMQAVNAAVDIFYRKVVQDELVGHYFERVDMSAQSGKLKAFLAYAFGAPMKYSGKGMYEAHAHMPVTDEQFNAVAGHLVATLQELDVANEMIEEVVSIALSVKDQIVKKAYTAG